MRKKIELNPDQKLVFAYIKSESTRMTPLMAFSGFSWSATQKSLPESVGNAYRKLDVIKQAEVIQAYIDEIIRENRRSITQIRDEYEDTKINSSLSIQEKHTCYLDLLSELERDYDLSDAFTFNPGTIDLEKIEIRLYRKIYSST